MTEQEENKLFAKGFNAGYVLNEFEPQLLDDILKSDNKDKAYIQAMTKGKQQHERDMIIEQQQKTKAKQQIKKRGR